MDPGVHSSWTRRGISTAPPTVMGHLAMVAHFKLTPTPTPPWAYTSLHDFSGGSDGGNPYSSVTFDAKGNLYGTAYRGGSYGYGVVWEITFP